MIRPGEEKEVGVVNGWRYVVERSEAGGLFFVVRKSLSLEDHGRRKRLLATLGSESNAEEWVKRHIQRVEAASGW